jgi:hypothetical protein
MVQSQKLVSVNDKLNDGKAEKELRHCFRQNRAPRPQVGEVSGLNPDINTLDTVLAGEQVALFLLPNQTIDHDFKNDSVPYNIFFSPGIVDTGSLQQWHFGNSARSACICKAG